MLIKTFLFVIFLSSLTGCVSYKPINESSQPYCDPNSQKCQVDWVGTIFGTSVLFLLGFSFILSPPFIRGIRTLEKSLDPNNRDLNQATSLNELLRLTGGIATPSRPIFQEVRFEDRTKIYELCKKILLEEKKEYGEDYLLLACVGSHVKDVNNDQTIFKSAIFSLNMHVEVYKLAIRSCFHLKDMPEYYNLVKKITTELIDNPDKFKNTEYFTEIVAELNQYFNHRQEAMKQH